MRFWVHSLESASKMADEIGIHQPSEPLHARVDALAVALLYL